MLKNKRLASFFLDLKDYNNSRKEILNMKKALYLVLKGSNRAFETLDDLRERGFNATVVSSESLKRAVEEYPEERHFFNLRHLENHELNESILVIFVVEEDKLTELKDVIRWDTNNFIDIKGFMYSVDLNDYEGTV